jgi:hypothetical protein
VQKAEAAAFAANVLPIIETLRASGVRALRSLAATLNNRGVSVVVLAGRVVVRHAGEVVADHPVCEGRRQRITDRAHFVGVAGAGPIREAPIAPSPPSALLRPLAEYEAVAGGRW